MNVVLFHDSSHYEAVVVGLPEHNYYLTLRMALPEVTGIDWHTHLGKTVSVKLASADPPRPRPERKPRTKPRSGAMGTHWCEASTSRPGNVL